MNITCTRALTRNYYKVLEPYLYLSFKEVEYKFKNAS